MNWRPISPFQISATTGPRSQGGVSPRAPLKLLEPDAGSDVRPLCYSKGMKQMKLLLPQRGGRRAGAGRPRTRPHPGLEGPGVAHTKRSDFAPRFPLHVTLRVQPGVGFLRSQRPARLILNELLVGKHRFGARVVHFSIQGTHLHLLVEAEGSGALSRAMQTMTMRIAKGLNALIGRRGPVFVDRYHAVIL